MAHDHDPNSFAHPAPVKMLLIVFFSLVILTILTLVMSEVDLGALHPFGFWIAMIIASIKASLVMAFFMHMLWDKAFNVAAFLSPFLFAALFIGLTLLDTTAYQDDINKFPRDPEPAKAAPVPAETAQLRTSPELTFVRWPSKAVESVAGTAGTATALEGHRTNQETVSGHFLSNFRDATRFVADPQGNDFFAL